MDYGRWMGVGYVNGLRKVEGCRICEHIMEGEGVGYVRVL